MNLWIFRIMILYLPGIIQAQLKLDDLETWGKVFVWESFGRCTCLIPMLNVKRVVKETDAEGPNFSLP